MASALLPLPLLLLLLPLCVRCLAGQRGPPGSPLRFTRPSYHATVYENSAPATYVESHEKMGIHVGRSAPGARYAVVSGDEEAAFEAEGLVVGDFWFLRVRTRGVPLDREERHGYTLGVKAFSENGRGAASAEVFIHVLDRNDLSPLFSASSYSAGVADDAPAGAAVLRVAATDADEGPNGRFSYALEQRSDAFAVHPASGEVMLARRLTEPGDAGPHEFKVTAVDGGGLSGSARVVVNVSRANAHAPRVAVAATRAPACGPAPLRLRVPEDVPVGAVLGWLDAGGPAGEARYSLRGEDEDGVTFAVHETSGALRLARPLDFERRRRYDLTVAARDGDPGGPPPAVCRATVEVADVDENRHAPRFTEFAAAAAVREDAPVGAVVVTVAAADEDRGIDGEVRYSLVDGSDLGVFSVHPETGAIVTARPLDRETASSYWLAVRATDRGLVPRFATLHVYVEVQDVNDNPPRASRPWYRAEVAENSPGGVAAAQVDAWDPDNADAAANTAADTAGEARGRGLTFNIVCGDPQGFFNINTSTGVIHTTSRPLDRERQAEHELEVSIVDGGVPPREARVAVTLSVSDENDNAPRFPRNLTRVKVVAAAAAPTPGPAVPVARVYAADADRGINADLRYVISGGHDVGDFAIDRARGIVYSQSRRQPAGTSNSITVHATDGGRPPKSSTATLHVEWIAAPRPPKTPAAFALRQHAVTVAETAAVGMVVIVLPTESTWGSLLWFSITGHVVEVTVLDVNDHRPRFSRDLYEATVAEETPPAAAGILRLEATDADAGAVAARLSFSLVGLGGGDAAESLRLFRVDPVTGEVTAAERLDREAKRSHLLTVMVQDGGIPVRRAYATLAVSVDDANDHAPRFTGGPYEARVAESAAMGSAVVRVTALDRDEGPNADVRYSISHGNVGNSFAVHGALGVVSVARKLDGSAVEAYELTVRAADRGRPCRFTSITVHVVVVVAAATADAASDGALPTFASRGGVVDLHP
ncbi:protocadherin Fat 1-like [Petromyzon marinus]|uniref:protocadherin Fat 1-like n=1 Tax=Petromyzon marinus TaxID=7757 RepID=UPI003F72288F